MSLPLPTEESVIAKKSYDIVLYVDHCASISGRK
jgi:hypothetical protein